MANIINFHDPVTTGAPMSAIIDKSRLIAEPVHSKFNTGGSGTPAPTVGQLWPRGVNTN